MWVELKICPIFSLKICSSNLFQHSIESNNNVKQLQAEVKIMVISIIPNLLASWPCRLLTILHFTGKSNNYIQDGG